MYRRLDQNADAIALAEPVVGINPRQVNALILPAWLLAQTQRETKGVQRLQEAIRQGGDHADVHDMLGRSYRQDRTAGSSA